MSNESKSLSSKVFDALLEKSALSLDEVRALLGTEIALDFGTCIGKAEVKEVDGRTIHYELIEELKEEPSDDYIPEVPGEIEVFHKVRTLDPDDYSKKLIEVNTREPTKLFFKVPPCPFPYFAFFRNDEKLDKILSNYEEAFGKDREINFEHVSKVAMWVKELGEYKKKSEPDFLGDTDYSRPIGDVFSDFRVCSQYSAIVLAILTLDGIGSSNIVRGNYFTENNELDRTYHMYLTLQGSGEEGDFGLIFDPTWKIFGEKSWVIEKLKEKGQEYRHFESWEVAKIIPDYFWFS